MFDKNLSRHQVVIRFLNRLLYKVWEAVNISMASFIAYRTI